MRKQFLIIVSVAAVSFLLGTLVSMGLTANGIMPNPFSSVTGTHIVRVAKSDGTNITNYEWGNWDGVDSVWNPTNTQNNAARAIRIVKDYRKA